ncbi:MAG: hypothetical protein ACTHJ0_04245 [Flavipsychrobacter sp.]
MNKSIEEHLDFIEDFSSLTQLEQVKLMGYFYCNANSVDIFLPSNLKECFVNANLRVPSNIPQYISRLSIGAPPFFIKKSKGYSLHRNFKKELDDIYKGSKHQQHISTQLRELLLNINSPQQKIFLEEAISCFEIKCYRSAIVMTWLLSMDIMYEFVLLKHIEDFNNAIQIHGKYKKITIKKKEDFSDIKEADFLELLRVSKIISTDYRKVLEEKLNIRNTAAHPNTIIVKELKAIAFIEDLVENVILKFQ